MKPRDFAQRRNFGKYRLEGMYSTLRSIINYSEHYLSTPLLEDERIALNLIHKDIKEVLKPWNKNYKKLKKEMLKCGSL